MGANAGRGEYRRTRGLDRHHQEKSFGTTRRNPSAPLGEILRHHQEKYFGTTRRNPSGPPGEILQHHQEKSFDTTRRIPLAPPGEILRHHQEKNIGTTRRNPLAPCHRHSFLCLNNNLKHQEQQISIHVSLCALQIFHVAQYTQCLVFPHR